MISNDIDMFFMLLFLGCDAVAQDFSVSLQVIEYLHIDEGIEFHSYVIHKSITNIIDLVNDHFYALIRKLSAFQDFSSLVTDLKHCHSVSLLR